MSFPYSDKAYAQVFPSQNQECLLIGMHRIFEYIGGVPARIRFDNMSTAVAQVLEGTERKLTDDTPCVRFHQHHSAEILQSQPEHEPWGVQAASSLRVPGAIRNAFCVRIVSRCCIRPCNRLPHEAGHISSWRYAAAFLGLWHHLPAIH